MQYRLWCINYATFIMQHNKCSLVYVTGHMSHKKLNVMVICHMIINNSCSSFDKRNYKTLKIRRLRQIVNVTRRIFSSSYVAEMYDLGSFGPWKLEVMLHENDGP